MTEPLASGSNASPLSAPFTPSTTPGDDPRADASGAAAPLSSSHIAVQAPIADAVPRYPHSDALVYDPEAIAARYRNQPLQVWKRCFDIVSPLVSFGVGAWWDRRTGRAQKNEHKRAVQLRELLTQLGPAFIKVGQALSTRPDLVSSLYLEELQKLQDQLPAFPNEIAYRFIEEELGAPPHELYAELTVSPVSAASLGQVYKGKLLTGATVAVKVQRPGLAEQITLDIYILRGLASWVMKTFPQAMKSDLVAIMDEFGRRIFDEMDYTCEGHNAERFAKLYGHLPNIYVPQIHWRYTNRRVLTMEWITGKKLTQIEAIEAEGGNVSHLVEMGVQCSLRQLLEHGFFHADPHPGNLLATPDGKLAYLDFGMMSEIKPHQRYGLIEAVVHLVNRDFDSLAQDYIQLEFLDPDVDVRPIIPALASVFNNALGASVAELNFKSITDQLSALMYDYPFKVPAYYALIIRSLVTLEGIAINVDPNFKVLSKAYPYIAKRLLTDPSSELRSSLKDLLFKEGSFRWNRLENLMRNARDSDDYDLEKVLDQAIDFLFSERGDFIREQLVLEIVNGLDLMGQNTLASLTEDLQSRLGLTSKANQSANLGSKTPDQEQFERFQRIAEIIQTTRGFDPMRLLPLVPQLLAKPELQSMGQQVASGLTQRLIARVIREMVVQEGEVPVGAGMVPLGRERR
ncbi:MAG: ABC1 kinase family protein [Prochlorothrix sp.]|nr:AarF/ABC1/UbiB kinase family protein [Prochlorothrix sp.]